MSAESEQGSARTCVGCREAVEPERLERFVALKGELVHDVRCKAPGRGAWVMPNRACLERALKGGGFERSFRCKLKRPALEDLLKQMDRALESRLMQGVQDGARARHLAVGALAVSEAMRLGSVKLLWVAEGAGLSTRKKFIQNADRKGIEVVSDLDGAEVARWLGREFVAVLGVTQRARALRMSQDLSRLRALRTF